MQNYNNETPAPFFVLAGRLYTPKNRRSTKYTGFVTTPNGAYHIYHHQKFGYAISVHKLNMHHAVYSTLTNPRILSNDPNSLVHTYAELAGHEAEMVASLTSCFPQEQLKEIESINRITLQKSLEFHETNSSSSSPTVSTPDEEIQIPVLLDPTHDTAEPMQDVRVIDNQPQLLVRGLATDEGAYPRGNFATAIEYEKYVALQVFGRTNEAIAHAAGLANAHAHLPRDPFPHGHCYLLMFKRETWPTLYKRGQDYLTKDFLEANKQHLDGERVVHYELRQATQDAHISLHKDPQNINSILIKVSLLAEKLKAALTDGVVDFDEYDEIFFTTPRTFRS